VSRGGSVGKFFLKKRTITGVGSRDQDRGRKKTREEFECGSNSLRERGPRSVNFSKTEYLSKGRDPRMQGTPLGENIMRGKRQNCGLKGADQYGKGTKSLSAPHKRGKEFVTHRSERLTQLGSHKGGRGEKTI